MSPRLLMLICLIVGAQCHPIKLPAIDPLENQISRMLHRVSSPERSSKPQPSITSKFTLSPDLMSKQMFDAFERGSPRAASFWIRSGADVNAVNHEGETALQLAVNRNWHSIVSQLIDHGTDCNAPSIDDGTLLHQLVTRGSDVSLARLLLKCSDVNALDAKRWTALHLAASIGRFDITELLVDEGDADLEVMDEEGFRPIHLAVSHEKIVSFLVSRGADITAQSNTGKMPIHLAVIENQVPSIKKLLLVGETLVFVPDKYGKTALDYAHQIDKTFSKMGNRAHYTEMLSLLQRYSRSLN